MTCSAEAAKAWKITAFRNFPRSFRRSLPPHYLAPMDFTNNCWLGTSGLEFYAMLNPAAESSTLVL